MDDTASRDAGERNSAEARPETEIKLVGADFDPAEVLADPAIAGLMRGAPRTLALKAVYFDTPDLLLHGARAALRVRAEGERFVITAKTAGDGGFSRGEAEATASSLEPTREALLACLPNKLVKAVGAAELRPVFRTEVERRTVLLETESGMVELALDKGRIAADGRETPVSEIELELKSGASAAIWQLAREIGEKRALRPSLLSKAERGFALMLDAPPPVRKSGAIDLPERASLDRALAAIFTAAYVQTLRNQPAAEDGRDAEGLHQFRVGLRRLRALLKLAAGFGPNPELESLTERAKALMGPLNEARELDVFLAETLPALAALLPGLKGLDDLKARAEEARAEAYGRVRSTIAGPETAGFELELGAWIEERGWRNGASSDALEQLNGRAAEFARDAAGELRRKVLKRGKGFKNLAPEKRHKVRIAVKNLRYVTDFFAAALEGSKKAAGFKKMLSDLQDHLGQANDLAGLDTIVSLLATERLSPDGHLAAGAILGWGAARLEAEQPRLHEAWKRFKDTADPWN